MSRPFVPPGYPDPPRWEDVEAERKLILAARLCLLAFAACLIAVTVAVIEGCTEAVTSTPRTHEREAAETAGR